MLKHFLRLLIASLLVLILTKYFAIALNWLLTAHKQISHAMKAVFSGGSIGTIILQLVALMLIPAVATAIPAGIYWAINRKQMPYILETLWVFWIVLATTIVLKA